MSILDTKTITPDTETLETLEAANSRFFIDRAWRFEDLKDLQDAVGNMAFVMRASEDEQRNRANLGELEYLLAALGDKMKEHSGHLVIAVQHSSMTRYESFQDIARDYEVPYEDDSTAVLFVPTDMISAIQPNPQFYGSGHDVRPVVNLGIETKAVDDYGRDVLQRRWLQVPLESTPIGLLAEV